MASDTNTPAEETQPPTQKKENDLPTETPPTEWIVRKPDGRMVVTDFWGALKIWFFEVFVFLKPDNLSVALWFKYNPKWKNVMAVAFWTDPVFP